MNGPGIGATTIAAVVPCYRVGAQILPLLARIGPEVDRIYVVDDAQVPRCWRAIGARSTTGWT